MLKKMEENTWQNIKSSLRNCKSYFGKRTAPKKGTRVQIREKPSIISSYFSIDRLGVNNGNLEGVGGVCGGGRDSTVRALTLFGVCLPFGALWCSKGIV